MTARNGKPGMGSTLMWSFIMAMVASASFVWLYDFARASFFPKPSVAADLARPAVHAGVWATITAKLGMQRFARWRQGTKKA